MKWERMGGNAAFWLMGRREKNRNDKSRRNESRREVTERGKSKIEEHKEDDAALWSI